LKRFLRHDLSSEEFYSLSSRDLKINERAKKKGAVKMIKVVKSPLESLER